ncbi:membrane protein [Devosia sp. H5989]|nr:membrane protein [Devosia sp. H5989]
MARDMFSRITLGLGGLIGGAGVALAAAASHGGDEHLLGAASTICLAHGPALLALGLLRLPGRALQAAALLLGVGTLFFAGDLITRHFTGAGVFPGAAPLGGAAMIGGWIAVVVAAFIDSK